MTASADAWDGQLLFLAQHGFRVVAHDRRGHGRSSQASSGNDMDGYADDLAAVIEALDLTEATLVGHSTGGGEVARYIGRHGTKRVAKAVLVAAVPPIMLKTAANTEGLPLEFFDSLRSGLTKDRSQFYNVVRDEGEAYAHKLMAAGVPVRAIRYLGAIHDLALLNPIAGTPPARAALAQVNDTLRTVFAHRAPEERDTRWDRVQPRSLADENGTMGMRRGDGKE